MVEPQDYLLELQSKLDKVANGIDVMSNKQEQMSEDIAKIKGDSVGGPPATPTRARVAPRWPGARTRARGRAGPTVG